MIHPHDNTLVVVQVTAKDRETGIGITTGLYVPLVTYNNVRELYNLPEPEQKMIHMSYETYKEIVDD